MLAPTLLIFSCLIFIVWQDFKLRAVYWWLFPVLLMSCCYYKCIAAGPKQTLNDFFYNVSFLGIQILFLMIYFSIKERKWINIFKNYLGLGDLFFLISITVYLSFLNYVLFYLSSLFIIVFFIAISNALIKNRNPKIPLAGYQAILLIMVISADKFSGDIDILSDLWLAKFLNL